MRLLSRCLNTFSKITTMRGKSERVSTSNVRLRGLHIESTASDAPTLIFFPEIFDQGENWLSFFTESAGKIISLRNIYILYPRNFGNSDQCDVIEWEEHANDVLRFMYEHKISNATLAGHGFGAKVALAAACWHSDYVTGYFGFDSTPMNQYYHEGSIDLRRYLKYINDHLNLNRTFSEISADLKRNIECPKWRSVFEKGLQKQERGNYGWKFNAPVVFENLRKDQPSNMMSWNPQNGLWGGYAGFAFPEYSRFVCLNTNLIPMRKVCQKIKGLNQDIFAIQGDENPQNHWIYENKNSDQINPYASKLHNYIFHNDGVHPSLIDRSEIGKVWLPTSRFDNSIQETGFQPGHYYHNWRFSNVYAEKKQ